MSRQGPVYDVGKLAKFFGVTKATARDWCKHGRLPGFKIGKEWNVRVEDLQKMITRKVHRQREPGVNSAQRLF